MKFRFFLILLVLVFAHFSTGCGKGEGAKNRPVDLDFTEPVYPTLPDTAPLRDQLDEAAAFVERELLEEQEKFLLGRLEEIRTYYTGTDGSLLISENSLENIRRQLGGSPNPRLKILCRRFHLRVNPGRGGAREAPENTIVRMLGDDVPAKGEYSQDVEGTRLRVLAEYRYPTGRVQRDILYRKQADGKWRRVRILEEVPAPAGSSPESLSRPPR